MRSLITLAGILVLCIACGSDETPADERTVATETASATISTVTEPGTIVEIAPDTATGTVVPLDTAPATQVVPLPPAGTAATPAAQPKAASKPSATTPAPTRSETPAQPAPQPAAKPAPAPATETKPASAQPQPEEKASPVEPTPAPAPATKTASKLPKTHTIDKGGAMHAPGFETPAQRCAGCHGKDLKGGKVAPVSCFSCHDQTW